MAYLFNPQQGPHLSPEELRLLTAIYLESVNGRGAIPMPNAQSLATNLGTGIPAPEAYLEYVRLNQRLQQAESAGRTALDLVPFSAGVAAATGNVPINPITASINPFNVPNVPPAPVSEADGVSHFATTTTAPFPSRGTRRRRRTPDSDSEDNGIGSARPAQRRRVSIFSRLAHRVSSFGGDQTRRGREIKGARSLAVSTVNHGIGVAAHTAVSMAAGVVDTSASDTGLGNDTGEAEETDTAPFIRDRNSRAMSEARETLRNISRPQASSAADRDEVDEDEGEAEFDALLAPPSAGTRGRRSAAGALSNKAAARVLDRVGDGIDARPVRSVRRGSLLDPGGRVAEQSLTPLVARRIAAPGADATSGVGRGCDEIGGVDDDPVTPANVDFASEDEDEDESGGDSDGEAEEEQEKEAEEEQEQEEEEEELRIETEAVPALPPQFIIHARRT